MRQIIYIDVVFVENLIINFLLIYIVDRFCNYNARANKLRLFAGAALGSCYVLIVFVDCGTLLSMLSKVLVAAIMMLTAFGYGNIKKFTRRLLLFYFSSFALCGAILALFYMTETSIESINGTLVINDITYWHILAGGVLANMIVKFAFDYLDNHYRNLDKKIILKLNLYGKSILVNALVDSGNSLCDPSTGKQVIIVGKKAMMELIPEYYHCILSESASFGEVDYNLLVKLNNISIERADGGHCLSFRLIPYKSLGVENGRLLGFSIDSMEICEKDVIRCLKNPIVALYDKPISSDNHFNAIAYSEILEGGFA